MAGPVCDNVHDPEDVTDLVQEVFTRALERLASRVMALPVTRAPQDKPRLRELADVSLLLLQVVAPRRYARRGWPTRASSALPS